MINLSNNFINYLEENLTDHHKLYKKIRCKAENLEELIVRSLDSSGYNVGWDPASHDKIKDIVVNNTNNLSIKSGTFNKKKKSINISGHRLGSFKSNFKEITDYLNKSTDTISVYNPSKNFKKHTYVISTISKEKFAGLKSDAWIKKGAAFNQTNAFNVKFSLRPTMSWQIWWEIPVSQAELLGTIEID